MAGVEAVAEDAVIGGVVIIKHQLSHLNGGLSLGWRKMRIFWYIRRINEPTSAGERSRHPACSAGYISSCWASVHLLANVRHG